MRYCNKYHRGKGIALIIILLLVTVITVVGLSFIVRGDAEFAYGRNMELKADIDYIVESGLEHARGLILNPQDISADYWTGAIRQQVNSGSNDYYDVSVSQLSSFNYKITSLGYREDSGQVTAQESLTAELRLNPCIVYWQSVKADVSTVAVISGDVYFGDDNANIGAIYGNVYSAKKVINILPGLIQGQVYQDLPKPPVDLPGISPSDFSSRYYIGTSSYSVGQIASGIQVGLNLTPSGANPAGVYYCDGSLGIDGNSFITGTLVVKGDLQIINSGNLIIQSVKNFPALIVGGDLTTEAPNRNLTVTGYTQIGQKIDMKSNSGGFVKIYGALYIFGDGIRNTSGCSIFVEGMPHKACLAIWSSTGNLTRWSPAAGAFYKSIARNP